MNYDAEFKRQTVRKVFDGQSVRILSTKSGVTESQIHKWRRAALNNGDGIKSGV
jgi:transposase-like protein